MDRNKLKKLEDSVRIAGDTLLSFWPGEAGKSNKANRNSLRIEQKPDGSFVTEADFASNEILLNALRALFPGDAIVSEEGPSFDEKVRTQSRVWIIDPLDGTKSFISGSDDFSILIALSVDTKIQFSQAYFPAKGIFGSAERGQGAFVDGHKLKVSSSSVLRHRALYYRNFEPAPAPYLFDEWMDSGMAFFALCKGEFDGVIMRMTQHKEWDLAAPCLMVEEAGGVVTDEHGKPISYNQGAIGYRYLVASNGRVHDKLLALAK